MHHRSSIMLDMNKLSIDRQIPVIAALVEGNSIRSVERARLLVLVMLVALAVAVVVQLMSVGSIPRP